MAQHYAYLEISFKALTYNLTLPHMLLDLEKLCNSYNLQKSGNKSTEKFTSALTLRPAFIYLFTMIPSKSPYNNHTMILTK